MRFRKYAFWGLLLAPVPPPPVFGQSHHAINRVSESFNCRKPSFRYLGFSGTEFPLVSVLGNRASGTSYSRKLGRRVAPDFARWHHSAGLLPEGVVCSSHGVCTKGGR